MLARKRCRILYNHYSLNSFVVVFCLFCMRMLCSDMNKFVSELKGPCILIGPIKIKIVTTTTATVIICPKHGLILHDRMFDSNHSVSLSEKDRAKWEKRMLLKVFHR